MTCHVEITLTHTLLLQRRKEKALTAAGVPSPIHNTTHVVFMMRKKCNGLDGRRILW
jgi:hypothetical protein